ncbi:PREDICTED: monocarboxylate transporter 12-B-like [Priapulus caudatus]|uniref:Monocarboxylate transporter 12-B-like n=1 Tax=Priapulus caudatus TaxID=37621 RepID=A0ABM1E8C0_PRICU|nr:PREDICTED: monocarboxylate transporter 12-B-like [Priapulus caudatus]XP_014668440.1 PREDICTED: monocarboxylate transporter 12-B-like [Priapulus caudatus]XP_014668441.1 PREDICTED: monocarboxylate transporter 12-B-like [Priapulus caudatus]XP_014668442.1 PREDICTED: monocarboxylate transporter 12-B-like [Priapulus caudatus]
MDDFEAPDGGWGWVVIVASACVQGLIIGQIKSFGLILIEIEDKLNTSYAVAQLVLGLACTLAFGLGPVAAVGCNVFGFRKLAITGGLLAGAGLALSYFAVHVGVLFVTFGVLFGVGAAFSMVPGSSIVSQYFKKKLTLAYALVSLGSGVSSSVMPPLTLSMISEYGYRGTLLIYGAITLNICVCGWAFKSVRPPKKSDDASDDDSDSETFPRDRYELFAAMFDTPDNILIKSRKLSTVSIESITGRRLVRQKSKFHTSLLRDPRFILYLLVVMLFRLNYATIFNLLPLRLDELVQVGEFVPPPRLQLHVNGAVLLSVLSITEVVFRLLWGLFWTYGRLRHPRARQFGFALLVGCGGVLTLLLATLRLFHEAAYLVAWAAIMGVLLSGCMPLLYTIASDIAGVKKLATAMGMIYLGLSLVFAVGGFLTGWLIDITKSVEAPFQLTGCGAILGGVLCACIPLIRRPDESARKQETGSAIVAFGLAGGGILVGPYLTGGRPRSRRKRRTLRSNESFIRSVMKRQNPKSFVMRMYSRSPQSSKLHEVAESDGEDERTLAVHKRDEAAADASAATGTPADDVAC